MLRICLHNYLSKKKESKVQDKYYNLDCFNHYQLGEYKHLIEPSNFYFK